MSRQPKDWCELTNMHHCGFGLHLNFNSKNYFCWCDLLPLHLQGYNPSKMEPIFWVQRGLIFFLVATLLSPNFSFGTEMPNEGIKLWRNQQNTMRINDKRIWVCSVFNMYLEFRLLISIEVLHKNPMRYKLFQLKATKTEPSPLRISFWENPIALFKFKCSDLVLSFGWDPLTLTEV